MSSSLGVLAITASTPVIFEAPASGVKAILIGNESGLTVIITMQSGGVQKTLYPGLIDWFQVNRGFTGNILINPTVVLNNVATFPSSSLVFDAIGLNDPEQAAMYPISLPRNTNIGNQVSTVGGAASSIQNDANTAGTLIIESTVSGDSGSAVSVTNDGHLALGTLAHPGSVSFDNGKIISDGTGRMSFLQRIFANLIQTITGNDLTLGVETGHKVALQINNADVARVTANGLEIASGKLNLTTGSIAKVSFFSGTANNGGTLVNHGLGVTPDGVFFVTNNTTLDGTDWQIDDTASTITQVKVFSSAGVTPRAFKAMAFKS